VAIHTSGLDSRTLHLVGVVAQVTLGGGDGSCLDCHLVSWIPYLFGPTPLHWDFRWYVEHGYTETLRILPRRGARPTPDLQHMILQMLSLSAAVLTARAYLTMGSVPRRIA
jgi:hypothetical protein